MKLKFTDSKKYNILFRDAEGDMVLTEDTYERLLNRSYKGKELSEFYEINTPMSEVLDEEYINLNYPTDTTWFIHPDVLRDNNKMKTLYNNIRNEILYLFNSGEIEHYSYELYPEDFRKLKSIFNIKYAFGDRTYIKDDPEFTPEEENIEQEFEGEQINSSENQENPNSDTEDKDEHRLINSDCKEYLEAYEEKLDKKDPRYYLLLMALKKNKGWAYIREAKDLVGNVESDVVTPKNVKKIMAMN